MASREEFERLALPLEKDLYFAALALCRRESDALDVLQETYLKAWRAFDGFVPGTNIKAWMFTILRNAWLDFCRARRQEPASLDLAAETLPDAPAAATLPLDDLLPDDLLRALRSLSPAHQVLILLADIEGLAYKEVAEALGKPIGSVMSGLFNARARLRAALGRPPTGKG